MKPSQRPCIPHSLFKKSFQVPKQGGREWRIRKGAWKAIQQKTERYIADLFRVSEEHAKQMGRVTVQVNDFQEALR